MEYIVAKPGGINADKLLAELDAAFGTLVRFRTENPGEVILVTERDLTPQELTDATAAVVNHNPALTPAHQRDAEIEEARAAIAAGLLYFQRLLVLSNGDTLAQQVATIRPAVLANPYLTNAMTKMIGLLKTANGWTPTVATLLDPQNTTDQARYVQAAVMVANTLRNA